MKEYKCPDCDYVQHELPGQKLCLGCGEPLKEEEPDADAEGYTPALEFQWGKRKLSLPDSRILIMRITSIMFLYMMVDGTLITFDLYGLHGEPIEIELPGIGWPAYILMFMLVVPIRAIRALIGIFRGS
jgi:hypothetical protein